MTHSTASSPSFCATFAVPRAISRAEWEPATSPATRRLSTVSHNWSRIAATASPPRTSSGPSAPAPAPLAAFGSRSTSGAGMAGGRGSRARFATFFGAFEVFPPAFLSGFALPCLPMPCP
jgi:hypothetical protein